jgi:exodeoxyribonuclease VII small subunit
MSKKQAPTPHPPRFEDSLQRLEAIVGQLEKGELALQANLELFEEGITLARRLERELTAAETRVEALLNAGTDQERIVPFEPDQGRE